MKTITKILIAGSISLFCFLSLPIPAEAQSYEVYSENVPRADGLFMDEENNLYVACEKERGFVLKIMPDQEKSVFASGLVRADGIIRNDAGNFYISSESEKGVITEISPEGNQTPLLKNIHKPEGLAFNSRQELFIAEDTSSGRILKYDGERLSVWTSNLNRPEGIAVDDQDRLYVNETETNQILRFLPTGEKEIFLPAGSLTEPDGIAYCPQYNGLFVTEDQNKGKLVFIHLHNGAVTLISDNLNSPQGVFCRKNGDLFVSEQGKNRILLFTAATLQNLIPQ